jgi:hypothetical protein
MLCWYAYDYAFGVATSRSLSLAVMALCDCLRRLRRENPRSAQPLSFPPSGTDPALTWLVAPPFQQKVSHHPVDIRRHHRWPTNWYPHLQNKLWVGPLHRCPCLEHPFLSLPYPPMQNYHFQDGFFCSPCSRSCFRRCTHKQWMKNRLPLLPRSTCCHS